MTHPHIVRARPPSRIPWSPRTVAAPLAVTPEPVRTAPIATTSPSQPGPGRPQAAPSIARDAALRVFRQLIESWHLDDDQAWHLLTSASTPPVRLTDDHVHRIALLAEIDAAMASFLADVGAWMRTANPGPLLMGRSPMEFLTRMGTPGFVSLSRQARRWAEM